MKLMSMQLLGMEKPLMLDSVHNRRAARVFVTICMKYLLVRLKCAREIIKAFSQCNRENNGNERNKDECWGYRIELGKKSITIVKNY